MNAQLADTANYIIEEGWIEDMNDHISLNAVLHNDIETFSVLSESNKIELSPNVNSSLSLGIHFRFISLSFGISPDFLPGNGDDDIRGNTNTFDLGTSLIFRHWFQEISYTRIKGYYLENTSDYSHWKEGDPYFTFPDLEYTGIAGATGYKFNPKFSINSLLSQTERQLKVLEVF